MLILWKRLKCIVKSVKLMDWYGNGLQLLKMNAQMIIMEIFTESWGKSEREQMRYDFLKCQEVFSMKFLPIVWIVKSCAHAGYRKLKVSSQWLPHVFGFEDASGRSMPRQQWWHRNDHVAMVVKLGGKLLWEYTTASCTLR